MVSFMPKRKLKTGIDMYYEVRGQGFPLVMTTGWRLAHDGWRRQQPEFSKVYQLITFDKRGMGRTDAPSGPYTVKMYADDIAALIEVLNIEKGHFVMGGGMGAIIGLEFAINYQEKVRSLILQGAWAKTDKYLKRIFENWLVIRERCSLLDFHWNTAPWVFTPNYFNEHEDKVNNWVEGRAKNDAFLGDLTRYRTAIEAMIKHDVEDRLHEINVPTLIIVGERDIVTGLRYGKDIKDKIPHSQLLILPGGHKIKEPTLLTQACLDFLGAH